jgi:anhydro-N-acetylmuramic acid kinase
VKNLFVGLISGTSVDGIDAALVRFDESGLQLIGAHTQPYDAPLAGRINALIASETPSWTQFGTTNIEVGRAFAAAAQELLANCNVAPGEVAAIGHHGQTVHHAPDAVPPFTIQIGDPNTVAARTGITTVADLRGYDMAVGGQGAPLVPAFHDWLLRAASEHRVVLNIGGIANITTLSPNAPVLGCDTGPGNTLLDAWIRRHRNQPFDENGDWAAHGRVSASLLAELLAEPWFALPGPKSTGRELFNIDWLDSHLSRHGSEPAPADVQATLAELTAVSISQCIRRTAANAQRIIVCGGGAFNAHLLARIRESSGLPIVTTTQFGVAPEWIEAVAFAWLARARLSGEPGNVPSVTGAHQRVVLGSIYSGRFD